jgi:hypothetical protein
MGHLESNARQSDRGFPENDNSWKISKAASELAAFHGKRGKRARFPWFFRGFCDGRVETLYLYVLAAYERIARYVSALAALQTVGASAKTSRTLRDCAHHRMVR